MLLAKSILASMFLGTALLSAGCQSSGSASSNAAMGDMSAGVTCDKCQTTYQRVPVSTGNAKTGYNIVTRNVGTHECPECRDVAKDFLMQGKTIVPGRVVHACKTCGGEMKECHVDNKL